MKALQTEYGFTNELGFFLIPRSFQGVSNFKPNKQTKRIYNVEFTADKQFITLKALVNVSEDLSNDEQSSAITAY